MPNNNYRRSRQKERDLVNEARAKGHIAARSAGSKSPVDVWIFDPLDRTVYMIQVKTKKGSRLLIKKDVKVWESVSVISSTYLYK